MRWAPLPKGFEHKQMSEEEETARRKVFEDNKIEYCGCMEEEG